VLGISHRALATVLGITVRDVQEIEAGTCRLTARRLYELSCALSVPTTFFFEDQHNGPTAPAVVAVALPKATVPRQRTLSSALRLLLAVVDLADREEGIDDDYYQAAKRSARAALAENASFIDPLRDRTSVDLNIIDD